MPPEPTEGADVCRDLRACAEEEDRSDLRQIPSEQEVQRARQVRVMTMMRAHFFYWFSSPI